MEEIRTKRQLKTWMQALMLAALLMFCPVSVLWTGEENQEPEERLTEGYAAESAEVSAGEETPHPQERARTLTYEYRFVAMSFCEPRSWCPLLSS